MKPNIVFIIIDAVRAGNVGCYGYPVNTTPNIDRIAERAVLFENAFSCTNATDPSVTSIFSGNLPASHGLVNHGIRVKKQDISGLRFVPWLPEILRQHGYITIGIDWLGRWHTRGFDFYSGIYDMFRYRGDAKRPRRRPAEFFAKRMGFLPARARKAMVKIYRKVSRQQKEDVENAEKITNRAIEMIGKNKNQPFFIFLHYWDTHWALYPPKRFFFGDTEYDRMYGPKIRKYKKFLKNKKLELTAKAVRSMGGLENAIRRYDSSIRHVDEQISRLFNFLEKEGLLNNMLLIITADHGDSLIEHGIFFEHHGLYDVSIKVPLVIYHPSLPNGKRIRAMVQHVDLLPTILELAEIKNKYPFDGHSLIPLINKKTDKIRDFIIIEEAHAQRKIGLRTLNSKYIRNLNPGQKCRYCGVAHGADKELYNLNTDPGEENSIAGKHPEVIKDFDELLSLEKSRLARRSLKQRLRSVKLIKALEKSKTKR